MKRIDKPLLRLKLTQDIFDALEAGNTFTLTREWLPYDIVLENWGEIMVEGELKYFKDLKAGEYELPINPGDEPK
jgi:hypothetical protein